MYDALMTALGDSRETALSTRRVFVWSEVPRGECMGHGGYIGIHPDDVDAVRAVVPSLPPGLSSAFMRTPMIFVDENEYAAKEARRHLVHRRFGEVRDGSVVRWSAGENDPPLMGKGAIITCDGVEVRHVTAFDTDEGWVAAFCDHGGKVHRDPSSPEEICRRVLHGRVEVVMPEGAPLIEEGRAVVVEGGPAPEEVR